MEILLSALESFAITTVAFSLVVVLGTYIQMEIPFYRENRTIVKQRRRSLTV